jgi:hypothetical protein
LTLHRLESSFELSGHAARPSRITSAHHQNGIQAAVYDSIGPAIAVHDRQ